jgi:short-subunit dehydrogenase
VQHTLSYFGNSVPKRRFKSENANDTQRRTNKKPFDMKQPSQNSISNKTVVITGASSGVGRAIAIEFAKQHAKLVLAARRQEALEEVAAECNALGAQTIVVPTDTRDAAGIHKLAEAAAVRGAIDIWINNAGVLAAGAMDEVPSEVNEDVIRTNLLGYVHGAHAVLPYFKRQGYGTLVNNISVGGWFPTPYAAAYSASKFGLRGFFEALKGELNKYPDIHICDLYPGFLDTPGIQHAANYTGKVLKPAPPVYDPRKVAREIIRIVQRPKNKVTIGVAAGFLGLAYQLFPALSRNITAFTIRKYLAQADATAPTSGNVLRPVDFGSGIDGSWRNKKMKPQVKTGLAVFAVLAGLALLWTSDVKGER